MIFHNVVVGKPLVDPKELLSRDDEDWKMEKEVTLFTEERFLPRILVEAGITTSVSEVRRNKPELVINLNEVGCRTVKWGKKILFIVVGEMVV